MLPIWRMLSWAVRGVSRAVRTAQPAPTSHIELVSTWLNQTSQLQPGAAHRVVYPVQRVLRIPPQTLEEAVHWKFQTAPQVLPAATVTVIPKGRVWGPGTAVITAENVLIGELSKALNFEGYVENTLAHPVFQRSHLEPPHHVNGRVALLSAPGGAGYYHWMIDSLPRLHLLVEAGIDQATIDRYLVNSFVARFQHETFALLGIPRERIIESHWRPHVRADELIVPSLPGDFGNAPRWVCEFLRTLFLDNKSENADRSNGTRLYLTREQATHRKVVNEDELRNTVLTEFGFRPVSIEDYPIKEQARMLSEASVVCGPHGAGLTNIVFCRPGTHVVEFLNPNDVSYVYWTLANQASLTYWYLIGEGKRPNGTGEPHLSMQDIAIDADSLRLILSRCCEP